MWFYGAHFSLPYTLSNLTHMHGEFNQYFGRNFSQFEKKKDESALYLYLYPHVSTDKKNDNYWCAYCVNEAMLDDLDNRHCIHAIQISINMTKLSCFFESL